MTLKSKIEAVLFVTAKAMQVSEIAEILQEDELIVEDALFSSSYKAITELDISPDEQAVLVLIYISSFSSALTKVSLLIFNKLILNLAIYDNQTMDTIDPSIDGFCTFLLYVNSVFDKLIVFG